MKRSVIGWLGYFLWLALCGALPLHAQDIHEAAAAGDIEKVRALLKADPSSVNLRRLGTTPLHEAARRGHLEVVKLLVASGADINCKDSSGLTPLKLALGYQRKEVAAWLREHGALVTVPTVAPPKTNEVLRPAVPVLPVTPAPPLLPGTPEPLPTAPRVTTPAALPTNELPRAEKPPSAQPGPTPKPRESSLPGLNPVIFPIHQAAEVGDTEQVRALTKAWPELMEAQNEKGLTPLHVAVANGRKETAEALLARRANVQAATKYGWMPLHFAATRGDAPLVALLLSYGASVNVPTRTGETPLHMAARGGYLDVAKLLLQRQANPNAVEKTSSSTPLHLAVARGLLPMVQLLVAAGANVNALDEHGDTPLNLALAGGHDPVAAFLREHGGAEPPAKPLSPQEQSLVDSYRKLDQVFRNGTAGERRKAAQNMLLTRADAQKLFPGHTTEAVRVADELQKELRSTSDTDFRVQPNEPELWKLQTGPPSPYVEYCQSKGWIAPNVPIYTLIVKKKGLKTTADMYCFVNDHWVPLPPLGRILPPP